MRYITFSLTIVIYLISLSPASSQDEESKWLIRGYIKDLFTGSISGDSVNFDNLIHNRLNLKWYPSDQLNIYLEVRNRFFWGETVKQIPNYDEFIDVNNDYFDLSIKGSGKAWVLHSMIDRAYVEWYKGDWEIRAGRQRINWGINTVWNPNDLFNAYSFFDFDYEERPGSDAIRIKKYTGVASSLEIASNIADKFDEMVMAGMWRWNKNNYDIQVIAGKAQKDITFGLGWAGNLKNAGFKGELTYFQGYSELSDQTLIGTIGVDYSFENSIYLNGSIMYNSNAPANPSPTETVNLYNNARLTAKDLSPFKYSAFGQMSYTFHPLLSGGLAIIYYPSSRNALYLNPTFAYSIKPNLDINLIGQFYFDKIVNRYKAQAKVIFIRLKWSF